MEASKLDATYAALVRLGYEVVVHGDGARVVAVEPGSPGATALTPGDVIIAVGGRPVGIAKDVGAAIAASAAGELVSVDVVRGGHAAPMTAVVPLEVLDDGSVGLGVMLATVGPRYEFPIDVTITTGDVVGPSAGLAFALGIIDELTSGELAGGLEVVATGTIDATGRVDVVGALRQKVAAARDAGADVLLVPEQQRAEAGRYAGEDLEVVGVASLDGALRALHSLGGDAVPLPRPATSYDLRVPRA